MRALSFITGLVRVGFVAAWSIVLISLALVLTVLTWNRDLPLVMARRIWARGVIWATGMRYRLDPLPTFDPSVPHVFVMNHQSMLDIPCAFACIPTNLRFVAKDVLRYVPFLGWYMWITGMIFVDRSRGTKALRSLARAAERIRKGASVLVFPEGTRSRDGTILPFKRGPFVLALQAAVPIVPVAIAGSGQVLPPGGMRLRSGEVRLKMGRPIPTAGRPRQASEQLMQEIRAALIDLHAQIAGPPPVRTPESPGAPGDTGVLRELAKP